MFPGPRAWVGAASWEGKGSDRARPLALTFLPSPLQIRWEKNITLGEPPGFLHSWWWCAQGWCGWDMGGAGGGRVGKPSSPPAAHSVFWDLYCAAPDRREACEHSSEAKAFQDYVSPRPRGWDQGSRVWAGSCGLGGLHGRKLAQVG